MADIIFPKSSAPGQKPQENGGLLVNAVAEPLSEGARNQTIIRRTPGMVEVARTNDYTNCRGFQLVGNTLLVPFTGRVVAVEVSGGGYTVTDLGALAGADLVTIAKNNAATPDIVAVTSNGAFNLFTGSAPTSFADADLPDPNSVSFGDGYFFFTLGDGRVFASGLNAVTINALDFTTCNARPGGLLRGVFFGGLAYFFGPNATEVYNNNGNPTGFPFSRAAVIETGLASAFAIAGQEEGWAPVLQFVGDDDIVYRVQGLQAVPVSNDDVVRSIKATADRDDLQAQVYMAGGKPIWSLKGPGFCWEQNIATGYWHQRESYQSSTWRGQCTVKAFDDWIAGEADTGRLLAIREAVYDEAGDPMIWKARSVQGHAFPQRIRFPRADFDFIGGVGDAAGIDSTTMTPRVTIAWSDDGGANWSTPLLREIGGEGEYGRSVSLFRTGLSGPKGRQWELTISDPVHVGLLSGVQDARLRTAA